MSFLDLQISVEPILGIIPLRCLPAVAPNKIPHGVFVQLLGKVFK